MRLFTPEENKIIKKLVQILEKAQPGALAELQVAKLLRKELDFFALKWSVEPKDEIIIYIPEEQKENKEKNDRLYFEIVNYIYFLEELEKLGFIKFQNIPSDDQERHKILYDREKYHYVPEENAFWEKTEINLLGRKVTGQSLVSLHGWRTVNTDFAKDLEHCALSIVYPLPLAKDYVAHKFKTLEFRQFTKQFYTALGAAFLALISAIVAALTLYITINNLDKPTIIDNNDLIRIESAINSNHLSEPIKTTTNDTIVIRQIPVKTQSTK